MNFLKRLLSTLLKRRVLLFSLVGILVAVIVFVVLFREESSLKVGKEGAESGFVNLRVEIPRGAFGKQKLLKITRISSEERKKYPDVFIGDLYKVEFADGVNEFALKPIRLKYYFDSRYFRGENYNNLALAYVTEDGGYRIIPGSMIGKDERGYFVEAFTYHLSVFGLIMKVAGFQKHGIELLREAVSSYAPAVLVVPGEDPTFRGNVGDSNIWEAIFPDRTLMAYNYALYDSRSFSYSEMYREFIRKEGRRCFIDFEADFLSQELTKYSQYEFDILAHGTGGLIVLRMLQRHPEVRNVRKIVLLSTPVQGTNVVNPLYFSSMFFGKDPEVLSDILGVEWTKLKMMILHIKNLIDTLGEVALDILPDSSLIKELENFKRDDVEIFSICGDTPPYEVDVSGTELEKFYPEFVKGKGDGFVSARSCEIGESFQLKGSFYDLYSREENISQLKRLLGYEKRAFPGFKDDTYVEYLPVQNPERFPESEESKSSEGKIMKPKGEESIFPGTFQVSMFLKKLKSLQLPSYTTGITLGSEAYIVAGHAILKWDKEMFRGEIMFFKKVSDFASFLSDGDIFLIDTVGIKKFAPFPLDRDIEDAMMIKDKILYARMVPSGVRYYLFENGKETLLATSPGFKTKIKSENGKFFLLTDKEVIVLDSDFSEKERILSSLLSENEEIVDATFVSDSVYVLSSGGTIARVSNENFEIRHLRVHTPKKILNFGNDILVVGEHALIDVTNGIVQPFERKILDAFTGNDSLFIVFEERVGVSVEEWRRTGI
ncbi:hypothetical protein [Thermotoga sp. KOL6]|uniref:hypothetical protein n=1 Tax=Thermotoga sp. KOL6 TaxID=126741 RepID=UPI000C7880F2|nr:hypothetical protein [Thermotoga sp. KOL6]PLV58752.1 hypothetical protein AS005_07675 [Thermotoga sp. KOL6]